MDKKVVLITGVSSGFGFELAKQLSDEAYTVYGTIRTDVVKEKIPHVTYLHCDVTKPETVQAALQTILEKEGQLHYLINNAGSALGGCFEDITDDEFRAQMEVNFFGVIAVTKEALPLLRSTQGNKKIIMLSSIAGLTGTPTVSAYNASKWAVEGFSEALFFELKPFNIDVILVEPGTFKTDIFSRNLKFGTRMNDPKSPYFTYSQHIKKRFDKRMATLNRHPKEVATFIKTIMQKPKPRLRYLIGKDACLRYWLRRILPFSWYETLVRKAINFK